MRKGRGVSSFSCPLRILGDLCVEVLLFLPEGALEDLVDVSVGERLQRRGPFVRDLAARGLRSDAAVPADLLHVVIKLDAMPVRIERESRIVDAGIELGRDRVDKADAVRFEECDGLAQLRVAAELDAERHAGGALVQAQPAPQLLWKEPEAVVLGAAAQKYAARAPIIRLLAADKADALGVEGLGALDIVDEETDRTDL